MNRIVQRLGACAAASAFSVVGLLVLTGCVAQPRLIPSTTNTIPTTIAGNVDFSISNSSPESGGAPSSGLKVEARIFAEKSQNPVRMEYTVTNIYRNLPIVMPIYIRAAFGEHIKLIEASPVSGTIIAKSLKPGEFVTGTMTFQIDPMRWSEGFAIEATTNIKNDRDFLQNTEAQAATSQGGTANGSGSAGSGVRTKDGQIEFSQIGWPESEDPGYTTLDNGTVVPNPTHDSNFRPHITPEAEPTVTAP